MDGISCWRRRFFPRNHCRSTLLAALCSSSAMKRLVQFMQGNNLHFLLSVWFNKRGAWYLVQWVLTYSVLMEIAIRGRLSGGILFLVLLLTGVWRCMQCLINIENPSSLFSLTVIWLCLFWDKQMCPWKRGRGEPCWSSLWASPLFFFF